MLIDHLAMIYRQKYLNKEVIVVDNGSSDNTSKLVREEFPEVRIITLDDNIGCAARNIGIKAAVNNIVVTLDDDVIFVDDNSLRGIVSFFNEHNREKVAAMAMKILDINNEVLPLNWYHPKDMRIYADECFETDYIPEGAIAFRKDLLAETGMYPKSFFLSHEGPDLAYRIINKNYEIWYNPNVSVYHKCSPIGKTNWRYSYFDTRNQIWLAIRNLPIFQAILYISYRLATTFIFCLQQKKLRWYFKALFDAMKGLPREWNDRSVLSESNVKRLKKIRQDKPGIFYKIKAQFIRQQILKSKYNNLSK